MKTKKRPPAKIETGSVLDGMYILSEAKKRGLITDDEAKFVTRLHVRLATGLGAIPSQAELYRLAEIIKRTDKPPQEEDHQ
jgi:hypothetical protein